MQSISIFLFLFLYLFFSISITQAQITINDNYSSRSQINYPGWDLYPSKILRYVPIQEELTFEKFEAEIKSKRIRKIEDAIGLLPPYMMNDNYVFMYRSRSLQAATPEAPRIITYTPTARFIVSFNGGHPSQAGHNTLEMIQFHEKTQKFEFREIIFNGRSRPQISEPNPRKCLQCHQSQNRKNVDMRPNWEPYNIWPGAINSGSQFNLNVNLISNLSRTLTSANPKYRPEDEEFVHDQKKEPQIVRDFIEKIAPAHPRYQKLGVLNIDAAKDLTGHLTVLNTQRVVRLMKEEQEVFNGAKELIYALGKCSPYSADARINELISGFRAQAKRSYPDYIGESSLSQRISWIFEGSGVDTSDWSMDFGTRGRLAFYERFGVPFDPFSRFFSYAFRRVDFENEARNKTCDELLALASEKLPVLLHSRGTIQRLEEIEKALIVSPESILQKCSRCHESGLSRFPQFAVTDPERLRGALQLPSRITPERTMLEEMLRRTSTMVLSSEQMPPQERLSPEESAVLRDYLERLQ